jgi:hypothetical protein
MLQVGATGINQPTKLLGGRGDWHIKFNIARLLCDSAWSNKFKKYLFERLYLLLNKNIFLDRKESMVKI